jgi:cell division protein FtsB
MHRTMTLKGFILILCLILAVFLLFHLLMKGDLTRKAEQEEELRAALAELQEEEKDLKAQLNIVGTEDYIVSSAMENYSYVKKDDIRFEFSNPEALYTYSEEELRILVDEMAD